MKLNYNPIFLSVLAFALGAPAWAEDPAQTDIIRRNSQYAAVQQAVYQLAAEATDFDADGTVEAPAMKTGTGDGTTDGGVIPDASGAPKTDGFGGTLAYCAWNIGSTTGATGTHLAGSAVGSSAGLAVISYGLDNTFQTTCANIAAGLPAQSDDYVFKMTVNQLSMNSSSSVSLYWGAPVADATVLNAISASTLHLGEVRLTLNDNVIHRWNGTTWDSVGNGSQNWKDSGTDDAYLLGKAAIGQGSVGAETLTVNGGATTALGLKGTGRTGVNIYNAAGSAVNAFLGYDNSTSQMVISSQTGALSVQLAGSERLGVAADGTLKLSGVTVFDAARNLTATAGTFTGAVGAASYKVGATTVIDASRNLSAVNGTFSGDVSAAKGTYSGVLTANGGLIATTGTFSGALAANGGLTATSGTFSSGLTSTTGTFSGVLAANGGLTGTTGTFTGAVGAASYKVGATTVIDASRNLSAVNGTFTGDVSAAKGTYSGVLSANGGLTGTTGTFSGNLSAADGTFSGDVSAVDGTFTGAVGAASYKVGATTVIDASRNLASIGNLTMAGNAAVGGNLTVTGTSKLAGAVALGDATTSANIALNIAQTYGGNANKYGIYNVTVIDNSEALTANRTSYGSYQRINNDLSDANRAGFSQSIYGSYLEARNASAAGGEAAVSTMTGSYSGVVNQAGSGLASTLNGTQSQVTITNGLPATLARAAYNRVDQSSSAGITTGTAYGTHNYMTVSNASTITNAQGTYNQIYTTLAGANIGTAYGVNNNIRATAGTIGTAYGVYNYFTGVTGTAWGIYSNGDTANYLTGNLGLGVSPTEKLHVAGNVLATGNVTGGGELVSTSAGTAQFRAVRGSYGAFLRNDGANTYLLVTNSGDPYGSWSTHRPFAFDNATGEVTIDGSGVGTIVGGMLAANGGLTATTGSFSGALAANGGLSGTTGTFSGAVTGASFKVGATTVIDATRNLANIVNGSFTGDINANDGTFSGVVTANGGLTSTTGTFSGAVMLNGASSMAAWNQATPGLTKGVLHVGAASATANSGAAITFAARDSTATAANAGIYTASDGTYGTKMMLATTDSYVTGSKTALTIDQVGAVTLNRSGVVPAVVASNGGACTYGGMIARDASNDVYVCK